MSTLTVQERLTAFGEASPVVLAHDPELLLKVAQDSLDAGDTAHALNIIAGLEGQAGLYRSSYRPMSHLETHVTAIRGSSRLIHQRMKEQHERDMGRRP